MRAGWAISIANDRRIGPVIQQDIEDQICAKRARIAAFASNAVRMTPIQTERQRTLPADPPEHVAEKILEAVEIEAAEVYGGSIRPST